MGKSNYFVGVRFTSDKQLFNKLNDHPLSNSVLVRKALSQYFRSTENNTCLDLGCNQDLVELLQQQVQDLKLTNSQLMDMVQEKDKIIGYHSLGFFGRVKFLLQSKRD